jgi:hypothetical protein
MTEYIPNIFLAACGILSLIGAIAERDNRIANLLWAFFCFAIAGVGLFATSKEWQVAGGIMSGLAVVFFVTSKMIEARSKAKTNTEPISAGDSVPCATPEKLLWGNNMDTELTKWETPLSDAKSVQMVSLSDTRHGLVVILEDTRSPTRNRVRISFDKVEGYQNILEEYRITEGWCAKGLGWTVTAKNSPWSNRLRQEPLVEINHPDAKHYIILTEDDVIDIFSDSNPIVEELGPTDSSIPQAGKSTVYFHPDDREQIDHLIEKIQNQQPPSADS